MIVIIVMVMVFVMVIVIVIVMVMVMVIVIVMVIVMAMVVAVHLLGMRTMCMVMFDQSRRTPTCPEADQQRSGETKSIVMMELELRKQIAEGDAEEHAGRESDRSRSHFRSCASDSTPTDDGSDGRDQCVPEIHQIAHPAGPTVGGQECAQREGIERLVKNDRNEQPDPDDPELSTLAAERCPEGQTRQQSVDAQADESPEPRGGVRMLAADIFVLHSVMMEADEPLQNEDGEESRDRPDSDRTHRRFQFRAALAGDQYGIWQQMEDRHPDHDARDEAEGQLHAPVREAQHQRQQAAEHGRNEEKEQG